MNAISQPDLHRLALSLASLGPVAHAMVRSIIRIGGEATYTNAKAASPVLTGYLRSTVFVEYDDDGLGFSAGATADYFEFVEEGTATRPPQPFVRPAFEQAVQISEFAINTMLNRLL